MAFIKCKMCGGELQLIEDSTVCECEYCGSKQTVPKLDDEKKLKLFERANRLRTACEFDKAAGVYESLVADFDQEAEAYWGLILCKFGIEYVDDPATGKKIPTCHRSSFDSLMDDPNFEMVMECADPIARRVYREEAKTIEELRKRIIEVSAKEEPYDVFISYKELDDNGERTLDSVIAQDIYTELTEKGYRVFFSRISLESKLGVEYEPYIFAALNSAKVMIVVGTDYDYFNAVWVKNEWSRFLTLIASGQKKTLIPVFKDIDAYDMPKEFAKLAAQDMGKVGAMQDLIRGVAKLVPLKKYDNAQLEKVIIQQDERSTKTEAAVKRGMLALEDGEWDNARNFFDQALTLDAECAAAYFGLALVDLRAKDAESFIQDATNQTPKIQNLSVPEDRDHLQKAVEENTVRGYLSEQDITAIYRYDLRFPSVVKGHQEIQIKVQQQVDENRNMSKALRFSKGEETVQIEAFKKTLYDKLQANVDNARKAEGEKREQIRSDYEVFLKNADSCLHERFKKAREDRKADYDHACEAQIAAKTIADYQSAIKQFERTVGFQDSDKHINQCKDAITDIEERERLSIYETACNMQHSARTIEEYKATIIAFKQILGYYDADVRIKQIEKTIIATKEEERLRRICYLQYATGIIGTSIDGFAYVKPNGSVVSYSKYSDNEIGGYWNPGNTSGFSHVKAVVCTQDGIVGLHYDGTCEATRPIRFSHWHLSECNSWKDISSIYAGRNHVIGLKTDGTCVANSTNKGEEYYHKGQCDVSEWRNIISIACGSEFTIGLKENGHIVYAGKKESTWLTDVTKWDNVELIAGSGESIVGLTKDGKILSINAITDHIDPEKGIVQLMVIRTEAYALYVDGTVGGGAPGSGNRISFPVIKESNIISIFGNPGAIYALTEDGRVLAYKYGYSGIADVPSNIHVFDSYDQIMKDRFESEERERKERALQTERRAKGVCLYCGGSFKKNMFTEKCISCGRKKDY